MFEQPISSPLHWLLGTTNYLRRCLNVVTGWHMLLVYAYWLARYTERSQ